MLVSRSEALTTELAITYMIEDTIQDFKTDLSNLFDYLLIHCQNLKELYLRFDIGSTHLSAQVYEPAQCQSRVCCKRPSFKKLPQGLMDALLLKVVETYIQVTNTHTNLKKKNSLSVSLCIKDNEDIVITLSIELYKTPFVCKCVFLKHRKCLVFLYAEDKVLIMHDI